ncbi:MAG: hypothetical protein LUO86_02500, partial [Methanomicrobiales archaeon]|nr:hypothetical protein [Methanomicrobiales archaeon]
MGFTIFIFCLIIVANMIPSLLVGLQRTTAIDYDAVAYRTAVILAEDPGEHSQDVDTYPGGTTKSIPWDNLNPRDNVGRIRDVLASGDSLRLGLAVSRQQPNILSQRKIENFFNPSFTENDYRQMLIFGDIQYRYNVTLTQLDPVTFQVTRVDSVGDPYPAGGYGYL